MPSTPTSTARPAVRPARDAFWDMVKALLIFLVILGHSVQFILYPADKGIALVFADSLFKGIYLFHMPCFIAISGYFAAASLRKKGHAALLPTLRRLLLPTCAAALLIIITRYYQGRLTWPHTLHDASTFLWFLTVAAECILCYHLMMWQKHLAYRILILLLAPLMALYISNSPQLYHMWPSATQFTYLWPFFIIGAYLSNRGFTHQHITRKWSLFLPLFLVAYIFFEPHWSIYTAPLRFNLHSLIIHIIRSAAAIVACGAFLWLAHLLSPLSKYPIVSRIGQSTLALYVLQTYAFIILRHMQLHEQAASMGHAVAIITALLLLFGLYYAYRISRKIPGVAQFFYGEQ